MDATPTSSLESQANDVEVSKKIEDEHLRLQRQVRITQTGRNRLHRSQGVHPQFRRQDQLLRSLKNEYVDLMKDLKIARSGANKKKTRQMKLDLKRMILLMIKTDMDCEGGLTLVAQLEGLLQRKGKEMVHLRKLASTSQGQLEERRVQSELRLASVENKLEVALLRFNTVQFENKMIRNKIEHMLKDRMVFNQSWTKMLTALARGKKFLNDLFESSTLAYDQRDEWCTKLRSVQEKGKMDQMLQVQEMRDLKKLYDHEMVLHNFLAKKGLVRVNKKEEQREAEQKLRDEERLKNKLAEHVQILSGIHGYTNESVTYRIVKVFTKIEHMNFSMYKFVTNCCAECTVLSGDVRRIRRDAEDRREWNEKRDVQMRHSLESLRRQIELQINKTDALRHKMNSADQVISKAMQGIQDIFKFLDCSMEPFANLLGDKEPSVQQLNLTLCLITEKINAHIQSVFYYERHLQKKIKEGTSRLKKYTIHVEPPPVQFTPTPMRWLVPADPCPSCVEARWLSRVSDSSEVPFDRQMSIAAIKELASDQAYVRSDRIHNLTECRVPRSRLILAKRYMNQLFISIPWNRKDLALRGFKGVSFCGSSGCGMSIPSRFSLESTALSSSRRI